ncbi:ATP12 family chaperone protein [Devosia nitrariae]|uniref:ATPase n=1 Tax=Devosia nitrariae TaxID=2071872 RepID=A0ABQ5WCE6_9HYPH|nr:ATP12 family protein [Devosia nitrariae]GLQ57469.1 ATPase [Devosia nitrariae]
MRDFVEDALNHRDDGYGRAQRLIKRELPKRFYKETGVAAVEGGYTVTLDGRPTRTPGNKTPVAVPVVDLAEAMAAEWAGQGERIDAETMPVVRLVNSALESGSETLPAFREEVVKYAASDLLLYRADSPRELVAEQERLWDDALVRAARHFGVSFQPTIGILHQPQPEATLSRLGEMLAAEGLLTMTALVSITNLTGSGILALSLRHQLLEPEDVWVRAHVDEDHQARLWGMDEEAALRRTKRKAEFDAAVAVLEFLGEERGR